MSFLPSSSKPKLLSVSQDASINELQLMLTTFRSMAFEAATILQLVLLITWTVLSDTPVTQKHTLFTQFFTSKAVLEEIASTASLVLAPNLFDVLQAAAPPTIQYFKSLPTETSSRWIIFLSLRSLVVGLESTSGVRQMAMLVSIVDSANTIEAWRCQCISKRLLTKATR